MRPKYVLILSILIICVSLSVGLVMFQSKETLTFDRPLKIGIIDYPPYSYVSEGKPTGIGVEIVKEAFKRLNLDVDIQLYIWSDLLNKVESGEVDVIVDIYITEERTQFLDFSRNHFAVYPLYFFKRSDDDVLFNGDLKSMANYRIGLVEGFHYGAVFNAAQVEGALTIIESKSPKENMQRLLEGDVDLTIESLYSGQSVIAQLQADEKIQIVEPEIDILYSYLGFSKANHLQKVIAAYDQTVDEMKSDGTYKEIYFKYSPGDLK